MKRWCLIAAVVFGAGCKNSPSEQQCKQLFEHLVDLNMVQTIRNEDQLTKCQWSPWHGVSLQGWPVRTWVMGQTVFASGHVVDSVRGSEIEFDRP